MGRTFHVIIEQDEDGVYIGKVPELRGCVSQGATKEELLENIKEAIGLCLEVQTKQKAKLEDDQVKFIGIQEVEAS